MKSRSRSPAHLVRREIEISPRDPQAGMRQGERDGRRALDVGSEYIRTVGGADVKESESLV